jgi:hypothetical protein
MGLTVSAEEIIRDRKILRRESFLNLSWNSYLMSKVTILFVLSAIQTFCFVIIGIVILEIEWTMLLPFWFVLFTTSCFASVLGLNISSAFNSAVTVYVMIPLLLIPQMILVDCCSASTDKQCYQHQRQGTVWRMKSRVGLMKPLRSINCQQQIRSPFTR